MPGHPFANPAQRKVSDDNKEVIMMRLLQNDGRPVLSATAQRCVETATPSSNPFHGIPVQAGQGHDLALAPRPRRERHFSETGPGLHLHPCQRRIRRC